MNRAAGSQPMQLLPRFQTGQVVATPGALDALRAAGVAPIDILTRHVSLDAGELCEEDQRRNCLAVEHELRVFSCYRIGTGLTETKIWCITEADRASTCLLLPEEY